MKSIYSRGKTIKILVVVFPKNKYDLFMELAKENTSYPELAKKYGVSHNNARNTAGQVIFWLRKLAEDLRDEELETITLRRETFESNLSVRQYLDKYGDIFVDKIMTYKRLGRIIVEDVDGIVGVWK